jgi:pimeloyl-ACP methyl ester carboxylesterase
MTKHDDGQRGSQIPAAGALSSQQGVLERSGCRIHYWLTGPEEGRLVAFTPGATMDHRMFDPQVAAVVGAGYRALTWDPRGHGLSKPMGDKFSVKAASEDLLAILDRLGTAAAFLVGQSLGGNVAQELVFNHPERVSSLVVIGCTCNTMLPSRLGLLALKASPLAFRLWPYGDLKRRTATGVSARPDVQEYAREAMARVSRKEFLAIWDAVAHTLHEEPGYRIERPLLITHGETDRLGNISKIAPEWAARDPNSRYVIIPDAGHNANQDNPTFFDRLLLEFLEEH